MVHQYDVYSVKYFFKHVEILWFYLTQSLVYNHSNICIRTRQWFINKMCNRPSSRKYFVVKYCFLFLSWQTKVNKRYCVGCSLASITSSMGRFLSIILDLQIESAPRMMCQRQRTSPQYTGVILSGIPVTAGANTLESLAKL